MFNEIWEFQSNIELISKAKTLSQSNDKVPSADIDTDSQSDQDEDEQDEDMSYESKLCYNLLCSGIIFLWWCPSKYRLKT